MSNSMQALVLSDRGHCGGLSVQHTQIPSLGAGDVRVKIHAAALNHVDLHMIDSGKRIDHSLPLTLGVDGSGEVESIGELGSPLMMGQPVLIYPLIYCGRCKYCEAGIQPLCVDMRFIGQHTNGTMAEYVSVPAKNLIALPPGLSWAEGACLPTAYLTAWRMVVNKARVRPGETVLVIGIGGGVSMAALQFARLCGAKVIVTSSSDTKLTRAIALGAWAGINYRTEDVVQRVMSLTDGAGVNVVCNNVGGDTWGPSLRAATRGGRIVMCGVTNGDRPPAELRRIFIRQLEVYGSTHGTTSDLQQMLAAISDQNLRPTIDRIVSLSESVAALEELREATQFGKIVVDVSGSAATIPQ